MLEAAEAASLPLAGANKEAEGRVRALLQEEPAGRAQNYTLDIARDVAALWEDPAIQKCLERKADLNVSPTDTAVTRLPSCWTLRPTS